MKISLPDIKSDYVGFSKLIHLASQLDDAAFETIELDCSRVVWIDANMCAPLGAILYKTGRELNTVKLVNLPAAIQKILSKNAFLSSYGIAKTPDTYGTTMEYKRFEPKDDRYFAAYVEQHMVGKGIPKMTTALQKKFRESIFEIFSNAVIHSGTRMGIFACGQFFPKKSIVDFSIADLGIGIKRNLAQSMKINLPAEKAIEWATEGNNTTKRGNIPGGLGLKLLREFIRLNKGKIQIASDTGYWQFARGQVVTRTFPSPFPGTVVNIEINTADKNTYRLASETKTDDIF